MAYQDEFETTYEAALIYAIYLANNDQKNRSDENYLTWCVDKAIESEIMPYDDDVDAVMEHYYGDADEVWDQLHADLLDSLKNELEPYENIL